MLIGTRLLERIDACGTTQAALARAIGVTPQAISKMVRGGTADTAKLYQIARFLKTTPEYLTGETDDPEPTMLADRQLPFRGAEPACDPDMVYVAEIDLRFGLGASVMDQEIVESQVERMPFPRAWLRHITSSPPDQLYWARARGNSMEPAIGDGDVILIDRSQNDGLGDLYWAIAYGHNGMVKRLRPMPDGSVKILSDNQSVGPETAYDGELTIFGRVVAIVRKV